MAGAIWCVVEDDRQGTPKKVMAEVLGEASRLASQLGGPAEAVWMMPPFIHMRPRSRTV